VETNVGSVKTTYDAFAVTLDVERESFFLLGKNGGGVEINIVRTKKMSS
jgi:hypothetical protein